MVLYGTDELENRGQIYRLLELAVLEQWGWESLPVLARMPEGKPFFRDCPGFEFNLSHSGQLGLCALSDRPVGVDIQMIRPMRPRLPERVCCPEELEWLEGQADRWAAFAQLWALKEGKVKQSGRGLREPIRAIRVPLPEGERSLWRQDGLYVRLYRGNGWAGAVWGEEPAPEQPDWRRD